MKTKLDKRQYKILLEFIRTFLPKTATERKNPGNEIMYIHSTLDRIFIQHFGFNLTEEDILDAFITLGYNLFPKNGVWESEKKIIEPYKTGNFIKLKTEDSDYNGSFLYIEVKADTIRYLRKATATLPSNTNPDKYAKTILLIEAIKIFKQKFTYNIKDA